MRLGVSMRRVVDPKFGEQRDALSADWSHYLGTLLPDTSVVPLPNQPSLIEGWLQDMDCDAVVLSNGNDWGDSAERDRTETLIVEWCRKHKRPLLGVCRGFQVVNIILGGDICTDVSQLSGHQHGGAGHSVTLCGSPFIAMSNGKELLAVNSFHDQGVTRKGLASALRPFALYEDAVVEGFYHPVEPILGIQWHPERPIESDNFNRELIKTFILKGSFWQ